MRGRDFLHDGVEQRHHVGSVFIGLDVGKSVLSAAVKKEGFELFFSRLEVKKELKYFIVHFEGFGVEAIDLVNENDRGQSGGESFLENEAGLGLGAFVSVHDKHDAVDHLHDALHFSAEVGVSWGVDDVDDVVAPADGGVLGFDRNSSLTLLVHGVHGALIHRLVFAKGAGLLEHLIHERGLAMINVSDDGNISDAIRGDGWRLGHNGGNDRSKCDKSSGEVGMLKFGERPGNQGNRTGLTARPNTVGL